MVTHYDMRVADRRVVDDNRRSNKYKNTLSGEKGTMVIVVKDCVGDGEWRVPSAEPYQFLSIYLIRRGAEPMI